jgi:hypothetical protein
VDIVVGVATTATEMKTNTTIPIDQGPWGTMINAAGTVINALFGN